MRQRELNHIQRAHEIRLKLISNIILVLVLAGAQNAIPGAVRDNVDPPEARDGAVDGTFDSLARAHVAEETQAVLVAGFELAHAFGGVFESAAYCGHEVMTVQSIFH